MKNSMGLHGYFMRRMEKILQSKGKKLIGWSEILEGNLSKESVVMAWHGYEDGIAGAKANYPVVMAPTPYTYLDLAQGELTVEPDVAAYQRVPLTSCYYEPVPEGIDAKFILGGEGALWTEKVPTRRHAEYLTWPRGWALAEVYWSQKEVRNWNNFLIRMETHMKRFNFAGVNYARCAFDARVKPKVDQDRLTVNISTEVPGLDIYYTIDETTPDTYAQRYAGTLEIPQGNVTLKVVTYRDGQPVGKLIALSRAELIKRAKEN
jgi:hexosaminidase